MAGARTRGETRDDGDLAGLAVSPDAPAGPLAAARAGLHGLVPPRYATDTWDARFRAEIRSSVTDGAAILDVGAGAHPVLAGDQRPAGSSYVGLDLSEAELAKAPPGSYDETVVADVTVFRPEISGRFDLALSFMVLEHVERLAPALDNLRAYLRPGGRLVAQMPGAFSMAALANRVVPQGATRRLLQRTQGRDPGTVFPAHYDRCWYSALEPLLAPPWTEARIVPLFSGVFYTAFSAPLRAAYLAYEELAWRRDWRNLAPYYLITARAPDPSR